MTDTSAKQIIETPVLSETKENLAVQDEQDVVSLIFSINLYFTIILKYNMSLFY